MYIVYVCVCVCCCSVWPTSTPAFCYRRNRGIVRRTCIVTKEGRMEGWGMADVNEERGGGGKGGEWGSAWETGSMAHYVVIHTVNGVYIWG